MKAKSTIFLFLTFIALALCKISAQEYNPHDVEKVKTFLRQNDNLEKIGISPTDTLDWNTNYQSLFRMPFEWDIFDGVYHLTAFEMVYTTCGYYSPILLSGNLDLEGCQYLKRIDPMESKIESLMVSNCPSLEVIRFSNGELQQVNFENCPKLIDLYLDRNQLDFNNLPCPEDIAENIQYYFSPQNPKKIGKTHMINTPHEFDNLGGTSYKWLDSEGDILKENEDYTVDNGKITFLKETGSRIRCEAINTSFPDLTITSDYTSVVTKSSFEYNAYDVEKVRAFINYQQNSYFFYDYSGKQLPENPEEWLSKTTGIEWIIINSTYRLGGISYTQDNERLMSIMGNLEFEGCSELQHITLSHLWGSYKFNFSGCCNLKKIDIAKTASDEVILSGCKELTVLKIEKIGKLIDLKDCPKLKEITLSVNSEDIDLSKQKDLEILNLSKSKLKSLSLSGCSKLKQLYLYESTLNKLDIENCNNLEYLSCYSNSLTFNTLPNAKNFPELYRYSFYPQQSLGISKETRTSVDLNHTGGTNYEWSGLTEGVDYTITDGITTFLKTTDEQTFCKITNPNFPLLTLETTKTKVVQIGQSIESSTLNDEVEVYSAKAGEITLVAPISAQYTVFDLSGKRVVKGAVDKTEETIQVSQTGLYLVKIESDSNFVTRKVIIR